MTEEKMVRLVIAVGMSTVFALGYALGYASESRKIAEAIIMSKVQDDNK